MPARYEDRIKRDHALGDPGTWGTKQTPLLISVTGWNAMHPFLRERMQHAHLVNGYCIKNRFGALCDQGRDESWVIDCEDPSCTRPAVTYDEDSEQWFCGVHQCL